MGRVISAGAEGRFESGTLASASGVRSVRSPSTVSIYVYLYALVVQRTERDSAKVEAAGSNPAESSAFLEAVLDMEGECARERSLSRKQGDGICHWRSSRPPSFNQSGR